MKYRHIGRLEAMAFALGVLSILILQVHMPSVARAAGSPVAQRGAPGPSAPNAAPNPEPSSPRGSVTEPEPQAAPGVPSDATSVSVDLPSRLVAHLGGKAEWSNGYKSIVAAIETIETALRAAGSAQVGHPFTVFLATDDTSFEFDAMVPIEDAPKGKQDLGDGVKIGQSPPGKAIKFLHRGAYDDIDSTYDLITAFLDEKGLDTQNRFIEEYLTNPKTPDDADLEVDIYVFLK